MTRQFSPFSVGTAQPPSRHFRPDRAGFTITELLTLIAAVVVALCLVIPAIGSVKSPSRVDQSQSNLRTLFAAHQAYANDWAGRQVTFTVDGLGGYSSISAFQTALGGTHPPVLLGWGCSGSMWRYSMTNPGNQLLLYPISSPIRIGYFRLTNGKVLHAYVNGRMFEPTYFAPADGVVLESVSSLFDQLCEFPTGVVSVGGLLPWSSYCFSPAAFYDPQTHDRHNPQYPRYGAPFPTALQPPALASARYPDLKTHIIEHHWLQNAPVWCNPNLPNGGVYNPICEPYYFNQGIASEPATVFYDGHTRLLPNSECIAADARVEKQLGSVDGLWFSHGGALDIGLLTSDGYMESLGIDQVEIRHTILTIDGILGRDTLGSGQ